MCVQRCSCPEGTAYCPAISTAYPTKEEDNIKEFHLFFQAFHNIWKSTNRLITNSLSNGVKKHKKPVLLQTPEVYTEVILTWKALKFVKGTQKGQILLSLVTQ